MTETTTTVLSATPTTGPRNMKLRYVQVQGPDPGEECWTCHRKVPMTTAQRSAKYRARKRNAVDH